MFPALRAEGRTEQARIMGEIVPRRLLNDEEIYLDLCAGLILYIAPQSHRPSEFPFNGYWRSPLERGATIRYDISVLTPSFRWRRNWIAGPRF